MIKEITLIANWNYLLHPGVMQTDENARDEYWATIDFDVTTEEITQAQDQSLREN